VDDGHRPCPKHLFGDAPHQACPERWVAVSLQSPASPLLLQVSGIISGGSPAQRRVLTVLPEPMELTPFQVVSLHLRHSPCRA
jgi:hypothetical protein